MMRQMASSNTILQTIVAEDKRGHGMAYYSMALQGIAPFASLAAGAIAAKVGAADYHRWRRAVPVRRRVVRLEPATPAPHNSPDLRGIGNLAANAGTLTSAAARRFAHAARGAARSRERKKL
jgi:hypothetical protein